MKTRWMPVPLIVFAAVATAQTPAPRIGVFGGINQSRVEGDVSDISNRAGGVFGAYVVVPTSPEWSIQIGALFSQKGWERDEPGTRDLSVVKFNYLEIPALMRYDFATREPMGVFAYAGPSVQFQTGCSVAATEHSTGRTTTATCSEIEQFSGGNLTFSSVDLGAIVGAGTRVTFGRQRLLLSAQYELGLKQVQSDRDIKNRTLTLGLGFELPLTRK